MATPTHSDPSSSTRSKFKASLVSLVKAPSRTRLPSLSRSRRSTVQALSSEHIPHSELITEQRRVQEEDTETSTQPSPASSRPSSTASMLDTADSPPTASQRAPSTGAPSSRSSGVISEFDSEASEDQYAELAKISFSAWARRQDISSSESHQDLPGYQPHSASPSTSPELQSAKSELLLVDQPTTTEPVLDCLPENPSLHSSPIHPYSITPPSQSTVTDFTAGEMKSKPVFESPKLPSLSLSTHLNPDLAQLPSEVKENTQNSPTATIIPTHELLPPVLELPITTETVEASEALAHPAPVQQPASESTSEPMEGADEHIEKQDRSRKSEEFVDPEKGSRSTQLEQTKPEMQDQVPISKIPQDSDSDSDSEPSSETPAPLPPLTLSLFRHLFDPRLSWSRKLSCVAATMAINLMLPFINGVMLGFGEIAARELVGRYLGWGPLGELYRKAKEEIKGSVMAGSTPSVVPKSSRWWEPANQGVIQRT